MDPSVGNDNPVQGASFSMLEPIDHRFKNVGEKRLKWRGGSLPTEAERDQFFIMTVAGFGAPKIVSRSDESRYVTENWGAFRAEYWGQPYEYNWGELDLSFVDLLWWWAARDKEIT